MNEEDLLQDEPSPLSQPLDSAPPPAAPEEKPPLNDQKKNALLRYMAILFGVAFLLVALSFLIQTRDSNQEISQLSQSNASALQNAQKLQEANRALTTANKTLTEENETLRDDLLVRTGERNQAKAELKQREQALKVAEERPAALANGYEFLASAVDAYLADDYVKCRDMLHEFSSYRDDIGPQAAALLDKLTTLTAE